VIDMYKLGMIAAACGFVSVGLLATAARAAETGVDVELILAVDVSRSMDAAELQIQREGYIAAFRHPEVIAAIRSGYTGRIAATYFEWAGPGSQEIIVPWTLIDDEASADAFASQIHPGEGIGRYGTSLSSSLTFAAGLFRGNGFTGGRRVIDVSGDGANNTGPPLGPVRDQAVAQGITINGLPIMIHSDDANDPFGITNLGDYYRDCVIGGTGAFTLPVYDVSEFEVAIRRKIIQEISLGRPRTIFVADVPSPTRRGSCGLGEPSRLPDPPQPR
jgi:hypothetical protein